MAVSNRVKMRAVRRLAKLFPPATLEARLETIRKIVCDEVDPREALGRARVTRREIQQPEPQPETADEAVVEVE